MPTVQEVHIYIPFYSHKHIVDRLQDSQITIHLHDILLLKTETDHTLLVDQVATELCLVPRISIIQDPIHF